MYTKKRQFERNCLFLFGDVDFLPNFAINNILYVRNINNL